IDDARVDGEDALDAMAEADLADGDALTHSAVVAGDHDAFKGLEALFVAFLDLYVDADGVAGAKLRHIGSGVLFNRLSQLSVLHDINREFSIIAGVRGDLETLVGQVIGSGPGAGGWF